MNRMSAELLIFFAPQLGDVLQSLEGSAGMAAYGLLALALLLGACGLPVPEEAVFATGGALAARAGLSWLLVYVLGWGAVFLLDVALFTVGRRLGPGLEGSRWGRKIGPARWETLRRFVARRGSWSVAAARFVMGTRISVFLLAGAMGMPKRRFMALVGLAGLVSAALPLALGYALAVHLEALLEALRMARWVVAGLVLALLLLGWLWWLLRRRA